MTDDYSHADRIFFSSWSRLRRILDLPTTIVKHRALIKHPQEPMETGIRPDIAITRDTLSIPWAPTGPGWKSRRHGGALCFLC